MTRPISQALLIYCATTYWYGMEVALYKDIHGFGQIFRQTGPVAPCHHWMPYELPRHKPSRMQQLLCDKSRRTLTSGEKE